MKHWQEGDFIYVEEIFGMIASDWMKAGDYLLISRALPGKQPSSKFIWLCFRNQSDRFICTLNMLNEMKYKTIKKDNTVEYAKALLLWRDK